MVEGEQVVRRLVLAADCPALSRLLFLLKKGLASDALGVFKEVLNSDAWGLLCELDLPPDRWRLVLRRFCEWQGPNGGRFREEMLAPDVQLRLAWVVSRGAPPCAVLDVLTLLGDVYIDAMNCLTEQFAGARGCRAVVDLMLCLVAYVDGRDIPLEGLLVLGLELFCLIYFMGVDDVPANRVLGMMRFLAQRRCSALELHEHAAMGAARVGG